MSNIPRELKSAEHNASMLERIDSFVRKLNDEIKSLEKVDKKKLFERLKEFKIFLSEVKSLFVILNVTLKKNSVVRNYNNLDYVFFPLENHSLKRALNELYSFIKKMNSFHEKYGNVHAFLGFESKDFLSEKKEVENNIAYLERAIPIFRENVHLLSSSNLKLPDAVGLLTSLRSINDYLIGLLNKEGQVLEREIIRLNNIFKGISSDLKILISAFEHFLKTKVVKDFDGKNFVGYSKSSFYIIIDTLKRIIEVSYAFYKEFHYYIREKQIFDSKILALLNKEISILEKQLSILGIDVKKILKNVA